jgi:mRNA interferase MazF
MKGKVILIPVPYTAKLRPALVIFEGRQDLIVAAITSKILNVFPEWDIRISAEDPEFYKTGLKVSSVLKLTKISTVRKDLAEGEIGNIDGDLRDEVNQKLKRIFEI